jgi:hypothetical protein
VGDNLNFDIKQICRIRILSPSILSLQLSCRPPLEIHMKGGQK